MRVLALLLSCFLTTTVWATAEDLYQEAVQYLRQSPRDYGSAQRLLVEALREDPDHLEARWRLLVVVAPNFANIDLKDRTRTLVSMGSDVAALIQLAKDQHRPDFAHYVEGRYAYWHRNFERALKAMNAAAALQPDDLRYAYWQARTRLEIGKWHRTDEDLRAGVDAITALLPRVQAAVDTDFTVPGLHSKIAWGLACLSEPNWDEIIDHYQKVTTMTPESDIAVAYAWNNMSSAYRKAGRCKEALEAAERALALRQFGNAKMNRNYAELCLQTRDDEVSNDKGGSVTSSAN